MQQRWAVRGVVGIAGLVALAHMLRFRDTSWALDDAWISLRIARNLVHHGALTYDITRPPVEGMTNLLWTLLEATWVGWMPADWAHVPARVLGGLFHLAAIGVIARAAGTISREKGGSGLLAAGTAALLVAASGSLACYAVSGLESGLWELLLAVTIERFAAYERTPSPDAALGGGVAVGLLAWTRPEGVLIAGLAALWPLVRRRAYAWGWVAPVVLLVGALEAFRYAVYGQLVPNTFHAKPPDLTTGITYVQGFGLYGLGVAGPLALLPALHRSPAARALVALGLLLAAGTAWSGGDIYPGFRRMIAETVLLCAAAGVGVGVGRGLWRVVAIVGTLAMLGGSVAAAVTDKDGTPYNHTVLDWLGRAAAASPEIHEAALVDVGRFGWQFDQEVYDIVGLTDARIAAAPGMHGQKVWDEAWFRERSPEMVIILTFGEWGGPLTARIYEYPVIRSIREGGGYRYRARVEDGPTANFLIFTRDGVSIPEETWGAVPTEEEGAKIVASLPEG